MARKKLGKKPQSKSNNKTGVKTNSKAQHPPLQILQQKLKTEEFEVSYIAAGEEEEVLFDSLLILLDEASEEETEDDNAFAVQAFFVEDMMKADDPDMPADETPNFATLQLMMDLPVDWSNLSSDREAEALKLLNACSQKIPIGHFNLDEDVVYFTYALLAESQRIPGKVLFAALDLLGFFIPPMCAVLEEFVEEDLSLEEALETLDKYILEADEDEF
jgi:hypothetical protein